MLPAIAQQHGIMSAIARSLGYSRWAVYQAIHRSERCQAALHDEAESMTDLAVAGLYLALTKKDPWAIKYQLSSRSGRARGYGESTDDRIQELEARLAQLLEAINAEPS